MVKEETSVETMRLLIYTFVLACTAFSLKLIMILSVICSKLEQKHSEG